MFDPPHIGHILIAEFAWEQFGLERIFFIPTSVPPHKKGAVAPADIRYRWLLKTVKSYRYFEVSDIEMKGEGPFYTYNTVLHFKQKFAKIFLIIGLDNLFDLPNWYRAEELLRMVEFIVAPRGNKRFEDAPPAFRKRARLLKMPVIDISSTMLRERLKKGLSVKYMVPDKILKDVVKFYGRKV